MAATLWKMNPKSNSLITIIIIIFVFYGCVSSKMLQLSEQDARELEKDFPGYTAYRDGLGDLELPKAVSNTEMPSLWDGYSSSKGFSTVQLHLNNKGEVKSFKLIKSSSIALRQNLLELLNATINRAEFAPAILNGKPVESLVYFNFPFGIGLGSSIDKTKPILIKSRDILETKLASDTSAITIPALESHEFIVITPQILPYDCYKEEYSYKVTLKYKGSHIIEGFLKLFYRDANNKTFSHAEEISFYDNQSEVSISVPFQEHLVSVMGNTNMHLLLWTKERDVFLDTSWVFRYEVRDSRFLKVKGSNLSNKYGHNDPYNPRMDLYIGEEYSLKFKIANDGPVQSTEMNVIFETVGDVENLGPVNKTLSPLMPYSDRELEFKFLVNKTELPSSAFLKCAIENKFGSDIILLDRDYSTVRYTEPVDMFNLTSKTSDSNWQETIDRSEEIADFNKTPITSQLLQNMIVTEVPEEERQTYIVQNPAEAVLVVHTNLIEISFESTNNIISVNAIGGGEYILHLSPGTHIFTFKSKGYVLVRKRIYIERKSFKEVLVLAN